MTSNDPQAWDTPRTDPDGESSELAAALFAGPGTLGGLYGTQSLDHDEALARDMGGVSFEEARASHAASQQPSTAQHTMADAEAVPSTQHGVAAQDSHLTPASTHRDSSMRRPPHRPADIVPPRPSTPPVQPRYETYPRSSSESADYNESWRVRRNRTQDQFCSECPVMNPNPLCPLQTQAAACIWAVHMLDTIRRAERRLGLAPIQGTGVAPWDGLQGPSSQQVVPPADAPSHPRNAGYGHPPASANAPQAHPAQPPPPPNRPLDPLADLLGADWQDDQGMIALLS